MKILRNTVSGFALHSDLPDFHLTEQVSVCTGGVPFPESNPGRSVAKARICLEKPMSDDGALVRDSGTSLSDDTSAVYLGRRRRNKQPRLILTEDEYQSTLSSIVEREYYPSLPSLRRDMAVLDRRSAGDVSGAVAIRRAARKIAEEENRLSINEIEEEGEAVQGVASVGGAIAPASACVGGGGPLGLRRTARPLHRETITGFHDRATSEDNEEFERESRREADELRERVDLIYRSRANGKDPNAPPTDERSDSNRSGPLGDETPLLASDKFNAPVLRVEAPGCTKDGKSADERNALFFPPSALTVEGRCRSAGGAGTAMATLPIDDGGGGASAPETETEARNWALMPPPASVAVGQKRERDVSEAQTSSSSVVVNGNVASEALLSRARLVEFVPKPGAESKDLRIVPSCTRFPHQGESRLPPASSSSSSSSRGPSSAFDRYDDAAEYSSSTDLDATPLPLAAERAARAKHKARDAYPFVAMTPLIVPGNGEDSGGGARNGGDDCVNTSPLATWGTVAATPMALKERDDSAPYAAKMRGQLSEATSWEEGRGGGGRGPIYSVPDANNRERAAREAEAGLAGKARLFRSAGTVGTVDGKGNGIGRKRSPSSSSTPVRTKKSSVPSRSRSLRSSRSSLLPNRTASLTPAAQALLLRTSRGSSGRSGTSLRRPGSLSLSSSSRVCARSGGALASALRASYTPKRMSSLKRATETKAAATSAQSATPPRPKSSRRGGPTTVTGSRSGSVGKGGEGSGSITDGLLNL